MAKKKTDAALSDAIEKLEHVESDTTESPKEEGVVEESNEEVSKEETPTSEELEKALEEAVTSGQGHADPVGEPGPLGEAGIDAVKLINDTLTEELEKAVENEKSAEENIVTVIEPVIPEPVFVVGGDMKVESFNHRSVTIDGKIYPINRAQHKALVAGDFSVLKELKK